MLGMNKSDLAAGGRWIRDHFSNWFANSFVMMGVFFIIIASIFIGMYFDGAYARRWSPEAEAEGIFRNYGWLISLAMVFFTAAGIKAFQEGARFAGATLFAAGMFFTVLSATQSIGVVTLKAQQMMASADAFNKIQTTDTTRLEFLKAERQEIIDTRNSEIARIEKSIDAIRFDDIPGIPRVDQDSIDNYNARIDQLRNDASQKIALIGDEIKLEMETPEQDGEVQVAPARFDPGIEFWAYVLKGPNATDDYKEGLTYWYMLFWSIGCPIMGQMLAVYLVITRRTSLNAAERPQKAPGKGILKSLRDYFWNPDYKDPTRVEAGKKAAETRKRRTRRTQKIEEQAKSYLPKWERAVRLAETTSYTTKGIQQTVFKDGDMEHVINILLKAGLATDEEVRLVKRLDKNLPVAAPSNAIDVTNTDPAAANGTGQTTLEGDIDHADDDKERPASY